MGMVLTDRLRHSQLFETAGAFIAPRLPHAKVNSPQVSAPSVAEPMQSRTNTPALNKMFEQENRTVYNLGEPTDRKRVHHIVFEDPKAFGYTPAKVLGHETVLENPKTGGRRVVGFNRI